MHAQMMMNYEILFSVGGVSSQATLNTVEKHTGCTDWVSCAPLPSRRAHGGLVSARGKLYSMGGLNGHYRLDTVDVLEPVMEVWSSGPPMTAPRSDFGTVFDGARSIYCVGGMVRNQDVATVDVLDICNNSWRKGPSLQAPRSFLGAAIVNGVIYAVGGAIGRKRLSWVERLDTNDSYPEWKEVAGLKIARSRPGVTQLNGRVYAVGGYNGSDYLNSIECYCPDTNQWALIEGMANPRNSPAVACFRGRLIVAGGYDGKNMLDSVESYDPEQDRWSNMTSLSAPRCDFTMCTAIVTAVTALGTWL